MIVQPDGPIPARIMLVGEAPGFDEERTGVPFVGASGQELNRMLHEVGIMRSECFVTNVCRVRPPDNRIEAFVALKKKDITAAHVPLRDKMVLPVVKQGYEALLCEIAAVKPNVIVAFGNLALWALTGEWKITKWRGSQMQTGGGIWTIPTIHPAFILREWSWRNIALQDLRRAAKIMRGEFPKKPDYRFIIRPTFDTVMLVLEELLEGLNKYSWWIDFDLETKAGHIDCAGLSWSTLDAICIPFMSKDNLDGYWGEEEEACIVYRLYEILTNPSAKVRGQNLLYDCQYTHRHWHFIPRVAQDTMLSHHVAFAGMRKSLDFQASLYCDYYKQWKPDKESWKEGG